MEVIEAFIEAARAPNFRIAAERCALSPAAFSRRIQAFTLFVGRDVFERHSGRTRLTEAGQECLAVLEPKYRSMKRAALEIGAASAARRVAISLSHSLAVGWLIPRLDRFRSRCADVDVEILTVRTAEAIRLGDADLGVCAMDVDVSGLHAEHMLDVRVTPVACPRIASEVRAGKGSLANHPLLGMTRHPGLWSWWAGEVGAHQDAPLHAKASFDVLHAAYEAAAAGLGIAAGIDVVVGPHLESGRLVDLGMPWARYPGGYRLVATSTRMRSPAVRVFWSWLMEETAASRAQPKSVVPTEHALA
jgi:DNA-binding transcriptional LysR family regulator